MVISRPIVYTFRYFDILPCNIGSNIALALAAKGVRVVLCDDLGQDSRWLNVRDGSFYDIVTIDGLPGWLDRHSGELRGIVHMGAISATTETDVDLIVARNTRSTLDLWEVAGITKWCNESSFEMRSEDFEMSSSMSQKNECATDV